MRPAVLRRSHPSRCSRSAVGDSATTVAEPLPVVPLVDTTPEPELRPPTRFDISLRRKAEASPSWQRRFEYASDGDASQWRREIPAALAAQVGVRPKPAESGDLGACRSGPAADDTLQAIEAYGNYRNRDDLLRIRGWLERALRQEPGCSEAQAQLAMTHVSELANRWSTDAKAKLYVLVDGTGTVDLDMVSLFPVTTWKNRPGGLRADIEIRGREHHRCHDVIGQNGDPVRPLGPDACRVDEDEIRRVRRIDLLDPAIHSPHALDSRRAQQGRSQPRGFSPLVPSAKHAGAVGIDQKDATASGNSSADQGARERGLATPPFPGHRGDDHEIVVRHGVEAFGKDGETRR